MCPFCTQHGRSGGDRCVGGAGAVIPHVLDTWRGQVGPEAAGWSFSPRDLTEKGGNCSGTACCRLYHTMVRGI